jgi:putative nucleotidyltransferase with HDIG domain
MKNFENKYIASAGYYADVTRPMILKAVLGSCVGVAMFDCEAGVGGLIHLLLPEPVLKESTFMRQKYAVHAMPAFIKALYDLGATRENLRAVVAGGVLVCPVSQHDLSLDIGGRTVDVIQHILFNEKINIIKSETGGFVSSVLSLNMQNWEYDIELEGSNRSSSKNSIDIPGEKEICKAVDHIEPVPQVILKILRIINGDGYNIEDVANEVRKDQVITAKTLSLCNSALFARKKKIETIDHALVFIGHDLLKKLIVSAYIKDFFGRCNKGGYSLVKGGLFHHAVGTAIIAEKLAQVTGKVQRELAYTAGLVHDIGKIVLDQYVTCSYPFFYREPQKDNKDMTEVENSVFGTDHSKIGGELARRWGFPEALKDAIRYHHYPEKSETNQELVGIVFLADLIMTKFHVGLEIECINSENIVPCLDSLGITYDGLAEIIDLIPIEVFSGSPELALNND